MPNPRLNRTHNSGAMFAVLGRYTDIRDRHGGGTNIQMESVNNFNASMPDAARPLHLVVMALAS